MINAVASLMTLVCHNCYGFGYAELNGELPDDWAYRWFDEDDNFHIDYKWPRWFFSQGHLYCSSRCFEQHEMND